MLLVLPLRCRALYWRASQAVIGTLPGHLSVALAAKRSGDAKILCCASSSVRLQNCLSCRVGLLICTSARSVHAQRCPMHPHAAAPKRALTQRWSSLHRRRCNLLAWVDDSEAARGPQGSQVLAITAVADVGSQGPKRATRSRVSTEALRPASAADARLAP